MPVHDEAGRIVDALLTRGVPMVLTTGYGASANPAAYSHLPRQEKSTNGNDLTRALAQTLKLHRP